MEIHSVTYHGWQDSMRTVEKRVTYEYEKGNDVTVVERRSYLIEMYDRSGSLISNNKGNNIDQMV